MAPDILEVPLLIAGYAATIQPVERRQRVVWASTCNSGQTSGTLGVGGNGATNLFPVQVQAVATTVVAVQAAAAAAAGSSYTDPVLCTGVTHIQGFNPGNGSITFTANCTTPTSGPIFGSSTVCVGLTNSLSTTTSAGGVWSSSNTTVATIDPVAGVVTAISPGTTTISYGVSLFMRISNSTPKIITVNPLPLALIGSANSCLGLTTALSDATSGGKWSSSNTFSCRYQCFYRPGYGFGIGYLYTYLSAYSYRLPWLQDNKL